MYEIIDECYLGITKTFFVNIDFKLVHDKRSSETGFRRPFIVKIYKFNR